MRRYRENRIGLRAGVMGAIFSIWFLVIGAKAVYLQVYCVDWLSQKASSQYEKSYQTLGKRGSILDRNRREMAVSIDATSIGAYPGRIEDVGLASVALASALCLERKRLAQKLSSTRSFVWIERQVTPKESNQVRNLKLCGVDFRAEHKRVYPNRTLSAQLLGFTGVDGHGLEGIEYRFNAYLKGDARKLTMMKDALGRGFMPEVTQPQSSGGNNLILTLDGTIQYMAENALQEAVDASRAKSGIAIVMAPQTGEVLALAHYPLFNPNTFKSFDRWHWRNRAITDPFEPGSTIKMFTAAAALEQGGLSPNCLFFCENGTYNIGRHVIHDAHPNDWLSLQQIIKVSSNIGAVKILEKIGEKAVYDTLRDFGFGEKTAIDCPGETAGSLAPFDRWTKLDAGAIAFGQGLSVSAVQLAAGVNAIANDGVLMKPYTVQAIVDSHGQVVKRFEPQVVRRAVSRKTAREVRNILKTVVAEGGTGVNAALEGYAVAGKTGTAQKVDENGTYAKGRYVASFVGMVPADDPVATILVIVDEPEENHYGGQVAAPAFRKIAKALLHYLNVPAEPMDNRFTVSRGHEVCG
ncbi:MAG: penicillin-binding protein 2 [Deltaproteobacteria bacterium]|nr:penicillin-binding protein 2 [Deltaproteobacteria bacterium]